MIGRRELLALAAGGVATAALPGAGSQPASLAGPGPIQIWLKIQIVGPNFGSGPGLDLPWPSRPDRAALAAEVERVIHAVQRPGEYLEVTHTEVEVV